MNRSDFRRVEIKTPWPKFDHDGRVVSSSNYAEFTDERIPKIGEVITCVIDGFACEMKILAIEQDENKVLRINAESVAEGQQIT